MKSFILLIMLSPLSIFSQASDVPSEKDKTILFTSKMIVDQTIFMKEYCQKSGVKASIDYDKTIDHVKSVVGSKIINLKSPEYDEGLKQYLSSFELMMLKPMAEKGHTETLCNKFFENGLQMTPEKLKLIQEKSYAEYLEKTKNKKAQ